MPRLGFNISQFQSLLFGLEKQERHAVMNTLGRLLPMSWAEVYAHPSLNWEQIHTLVGPSGQTLYSLRASQKMRLVGWREAEILRLLSIHPDHDSAYTR